MLSILTYFMLLLHATARVTSKLERLQRNFYGIQHPLSQLRTLQLQRKEGLALKDLQVSNKPH